MFKKWFVIFFLCFAIIIIMAFDPIENLYNSLIFLPTKEFLSSPKDGGITFEEVFIKTEDGETLYGYFLPYKEKTNKVVIYLHGNADNVSSWYTACTEIQKHVPVNALIVDYRGYGKSTGSPSRAAVIKDAISMYDYLIQRGYKPEDISVYGRSIGGAIGLELAVRKNVKSIVIQSSFTSLKDIAKDLYPYLPNILIKNDLWNSSELIKQIKVPVLISHGEKDEIVPVSHSYKLYELANEPKKLILLKDASHNDISSYFNEEYFEGLRELFI